jgi:ribosomal protein S18 acetylase RimI-like enzyme
MRPGCLADMPRVLDLWRDEVRAGRRDCVPGDVHLRRMIAGFDWEARSRVVEKANGGLDGAVLVSNRATPLGTVAAVEASAADNRPELLHELTRWGLRLSQAAGAFAAQVWRGRGHTDGLDRLGMTLVRPWWRMDRGLTNARVHTAPVAGYELINAGAVPAATWAQVHNLAFADHWRFSPRTADELMVGRPPALSLMAGTVGGSLAALTLCQIESYTSDRRPQPVGVISSVGTLPDHRRRGLATWLVAEALHRLHQSGARHASLYVDGWNPTRAFDAYSKLGFDLAFETEVWEATFQ